MSPQRRAGRPPGPHDDTLGRLLPTALRLFLTEGGAALTPTRLHQETGVARATIYRNWPEPADLVEIMLRRATELPSSTAPVGDLRTDLGAAMALLIDRFEHKPVRAFFAACLEFGRRSERIASVADDYVAGLLEPFRRAVAAAVDRGELVGAVDELVADLTGPLLLRHVLLGERITASDGRRQVDRFVRSGASVPSGQAGTARQAGTAGRP